MGAKTRKLSQINDSLIEWQSVVVADGSTGLTAVAGRGYFINTTAGAITVTLPSATAKPGDTIQLKDYARTWGTNAVSIASNTFDGVGSRTPSFSTNGQTVTLVYMDNTKGWSLVNEDTTTGLGAAFISATGGTVTTSGDFKIHTFTGDGCFVVATAGNPAGSTTVDYLVVAGGGGAGATHGGGGGAGGFRESKDTTINSPHTASPLAATTGITVSSQTYPITVGGGGSGTSFPPVNIGGVGSNSVFSTITSTGGGGGSGGFPPSSALPGGSGGGGGNGAPHGPGSGNTPPTSPPQGNNGGSGNNPGGTGGGGGATATGTTTVSNTGGNGGAGATTSITGSPTAYAGGGGGGASAGTEGTGGTGGGANGTVTPSTTGGVGSANTGGGGGGGGSSGNGGAGGKGIVVIRYKFQ